MMKLYFNDVLPENDIYKLGKVYYSFEDQIINYKEMKALFKQIGYPILEVHCKNPEDGRVCKTMKQCEELKNRITNENYTKGDIHDLILDNKGKQVLFKQGRDLLGVMAKYGDESAINALQGINHTETLIRSGLKG